MKLSLILGFASCLATLAASPAGRYAGEPPPVSVRESSSSVEPVLLGADQRLYLPGATLVAPDKAAEIVARFGEAYGRSGRPRLVVAVNRELIDGATGLHLSARKERVEEARIRYSGELVPTGEIPSAPAQTQVNVAIGGQAGTSSMPMAKGDASTRTEKRVADNEYTAVPPAPVQLADRQTVRDVERLFGRPLRAGGAQLADQRVVAQLIADKPMDHFLPGANESARKDREALAVAADAVVEILISTRSLTTAGFSGDETFPVPDIQATIVRLKDGAILAQASSADVLGKDRYAGAVVRVFDVNDIAEATALALMEDFVLTAP